MEIVFAKFLWNRKGNDARKFQQSVAVSRLAGLAFSSLDLHHNISFPTLKGVHSSGVKGKNDNTLTKRREPMV